MPDLIGRATARYGPFTGVRFTTHRHLARRDQMLGDATTFSHDFRVDPIEGSIYRRGGALNIGGATGVLETVVADASARGLQIIALDSASLADGYPTHAVLFADESKYAGWLYWYSTDSSGYDLQLGEIESHANHYPPSDSVSAEGIWMPVAYEANGIALTRGATELTRRFIVSGSRRMAQVGNDLCLPGFLSSGVSWRGKRFNNTTDAGETDQQFLGPTGLVPPLHCGRYVTANLPTATTTASAWKEGDQFYASWAFVNENGEVSMPYIPSGATGTTRTSEYVTDMGLVTVPSTTANVDYYQYLRNENIPVGPPGTVARLRLRSPKVDSTVSGSFPNRLDLRICGIIKDNTSTTFDDYSGDDLILIEDPALVRLDRKMPDRARYMWVFDQRIGLGYLRPPPYAIVIAPTGRTNPRDMNNLATTVVPISANYALVRVNDSSQLQLRRSTAGAVAATQNISTASTQSLRAIVDDVNETTTASAADEFCAQVAPGVPEDVTGDKLAQQYFVVACSGTASTLTATAGNFAEVAIGMRVTDGTTAANISANTYVKSVESTTSLTLSAAVAGAFVGDNIVFHNVTNDESFVNADADKGSVFAFGNSWPVWLPFKKSYLDGLPTRKGDVEFTTGGPADPPYAVNSYVAGNRRSAPADAGICMGGAPLLNGCIVCFSRAIGRLYNIRGGKTGEDADYRLEIFSWGRGCISPYSIVYGNGWVGYLTDQGFVVTDGVNERVISLDEYNPAHKEGFWAYEIAQCKNAADTDGTDYQFHAAVGDGKLVVSFRRAANQGPSSANIPSHVQEYNFSGSKEASGLAQVLQPDGTPWGWSSVLGYSWRGYSATAGVVGALGFVRKSTGTNLYTCDDANDKTTCGLVAHIENGTWTDGATNRVQADAYLLTDMHGTLENKRAETVRVMYYAPGASESMVLYRLLSRGSGSTFTLTATSGVPYRRAVMPVPLARRTLTGQTELLLQATGASGSTDVRYFMAELDVSVFKAGRTFGG